MNGLSKVRSINFLLITIALSFIVITVTAAAFIPSSENSISALWRASVTYKFPVLDKLVKSASSVNALSIPNSFKSSFNFKL